MEFKDLQNMINSIDEEDREELLNSLVTSSQSNKLLSPKIIKKTSSHEDSNSDYKDVMFTATNSNETIRVNQGSFTRKDWIEAQNVISKDNDIPIFTGFASNAYDINFVKDKDECPKCGSKTKRMLAQFHYGTKTLHRTMFTSAGNFCTSCSSVIVDQNIIRLGVAEGYEFTSVLGVDPQDGDFNDPTFFKTWNGEKATFLFDDEDGSNARIITRTEYKRLKESNKIVQSTEQDTAPFEISNFLKPKRNAPCSCGSGKKYKHCCGKN